MSENEKNINRIRIHELKLHCIYCISALITLTVNKTVFEGYVWLGLLECSCFTDILRIVCFIALL